MAFLTIRNLRIGGKDARQTRIERLLEAGAQWRPDDAYEMNSVRKTLYKCEPAVTVALMKLFAKHKAAPEELLEELLDTPRMRGHLSATGMKL